MDFSVTQLLQIFVESLFVGFGILVPIITLIKTANLKALRLKELFILQAVQVARIAGICYVLLQVPVFYDAWQLQKSGITVPGGIFSYFGLMLFYSPVFYLIISQCFWFKKLYIKKAALITMSILLLIIPSQQFMYFITSYFRTDYLPSSWTMYTGSLAIKTAINVVMFFCTIFVVMQVSGKLKFLADK